MTRDLKWGRGTDWRLEVAAEGLTGDLKWGLGE